MAGDIWLSESLRSAPWIIVWKCRLLLELWQLPAWEVPKWHKSNLGNNPRLSECPSRGFRTSPSRAPQEVHTQTLGENCSSVLPPRSYPVSQVILSPWASHLPCHLHSGLHSSIYSRDRDAAVLARETQWGHTANDSLNPWSPTLTLCLMINVLKSTEKVFEIYHQVINHSLFFSLLNKKQLTNTRQAYILKVIKCVWVSYTKQPNLLIHKYEGIEKQAFEPEWMKTQTVISHPGLQEAVY